MGFIHNIGTVARYEAKTLRRSWFFRIFALLIVLLTVVMTLTTFSPLGPERWNMIAIATALPHFSIYLANIFQAVILVFLASDFMKRDKKVDTNEVLYTRSMSNLEYVLGKTWGIFKLFLGMSLVVIAIALVINIISPQIEVSYSTYLSHLLLISVPTIVFSLGFAYLAMSVIKNQAITIFLVLAYIAVSVFYLHDRAGYIFDYMAFGIPMFKSGMIGYDNLPLILAQRLMYFSLGASFIMATAILFRRLPQSLGQVTVSRITMVLLLVVAAGSAFYVVNDYRADGRVKARTIATNERYENMGFATVTDVAIDLEHRNSSIRATAEITLRNDHRGSLSDIVLSLNPGLKVSEVKIDGEATEFVRDNHIITAAAKGGIPAGDSRVISVAYRGTINEAYIYPNHDEDNELFPYRVGQMLNINKRQAFLSGSYMLLTPEAHWYPVATLNYYPGNPARIKVDFANYSLNVKTDKGLMAVSQGDVVREGTNHQFRSSTPLIGMTLAIGDYRHETITAGETKISVYHYPGNDYYRELFSEIGDTLPHLITVLLDDLETNFHVPYPFASINFVEVPVQFFSYPKKNTQTRAEVQPEMVLLPERLATLNQAGFSRSIRNQQRAAERRGQVLTDQDLQLRVFNNFARTNFITGTFSSPGRRTMAPPQHEPTRYMLGPSFYLFKNNFYSDDFPVINTVFETHLQDVSINVRGTRGFMGGLTDRDRAALVLKGKSFSEVLATTRGEDTLRAVLQVKGDYLFNLMRAQAGIEEFSEWFIDYLEETKFTRVDISQFDNDLYERFGFTISEHLPAWYNATEIPGFIFTDIEVSEIIVDERPRYQVTFTAINPEQGGGLFNVSVGGGILGMMPGGGGRGGGGGTAAVVSAMSGPGGMAGAAQRIASSITGGRGLTASDIDKIVWMDPVQAKRVGLIAENRPRSISINTLISQNIPGEIMFPVGEVGETPIGTIPFEGEEILSSIPVLTEANEIIVDNEDDGFYASVTEETSPLRRLLRLGDDDDGTYGMVRPFMIPEFWQPVIHADYFGKFIRSAVYTRSGGGERYVSWTADIEAPGNYDVYAYIPKSNMRAMFGGRGGSGGGTSGGTTGVTTGGSGIAPPGMQPSPEERAQTGRGRRQPMVTTLQFFVHHDDGTEDITVDFEAADPGWNRLGTYYLSPGPAMVKLTNNSTGRYVIGDAIKWVRRE